MRQVPPSLEAAQYWYVVNCECPKERAAAVALECGLGLTVYLPLVRRHVRGKLRDSPFFSGYLFVQANLREGEVGLTAINATPGVIRVVAFGREPAQVPESVIELVRRQVDVINAQGGLPTHTFHHGNTVRISGGPLEGLNGIFLEQRSSNERARVLIEFLGQLRQLELETHLLEPASAPPTPEERPRRRTRGRGRPILTRVPR